MTQIKSTKKKTVTVNQKKAMPVSRDLQETLKQRADQLFVLHGRLSRCIAALREYGDVPDDIEMNAIAGNYIELKNAIIEYKKKHEGPVAAVLNTFEEVLSFADQAVKVKFDNPRVMQILRGACFDLSIFYSSKYQDVLEHNIEKFMAIENILTGRSHEAIGYWTKKIEERKRSRKGGEIPKTNQPILLALMTYLEDHPKLVGKSNYQIGESFKRNVRKVKPIIVNFHGCEWDVYFADNCVWAEPDTNNKLKNRVKSIAYITFKQNYISKAKKEIKKKQFT